MGKKSHHSNSVFRASLPCWDNDGNPVSIDLVSWNSNFYRYPSTRDAALDDSPAEFRQVYLRYQDTPNHTVTFDIDDSRIIANGFTSEDTGNTFMLTNTHPFHTKTYSEKPGNGGFNVDFGQCLGLDYVNLDVPRKPMPRIDDTWRV